MGPILGMRGGIVNGEGKVEREQGVWVQSAHRPLITTTPTIITVTMGTRLTGVRPCSPLVGQGHVTGEIGMTT